MKKRLLSLLLALTLACSLLVFPANAAEVLDEGDYDSLHWVLTSDGTVTISGEGTISDSLKKCWSQWGNLISSLVIQSSGTISFNAFEFCRNLVNVTIGEKIDKIYAEAFQECNNIANITICSGCTSIGYHAFENCDSLKSVIIPDSVTELDDGIFYGCDSLESVTLPSKLTALQCNFEVLGGIFQGCGRLKSIIIPETVTSIGARTFFGCASLQSIVIPDSVTTIGADAFNGCSGLTTITVPANVTSIGEKAFECSNLTEIIVDKNNTKYQSDSGVLMNKTGTQLIKYPAKKTGNYQIPSSVIAITNSAFSDCVGLGNIIIPNGVSIIGDRAFYNCSNLEEMTIPDSVTNIGEEAFYGCSSLKSLMIPEGVTSIADNTFCCCSSLASVTIPNSVNSIGYSAFQHCSSLSDVIIPRGVASIGGNAFFGCSLNSITIPTSVTSIGERAFYDSITLKDIYYGGNEEQWAAISVGGYNYALDSATIHFGASTPAKIETDPTDAAAPVGTDVCFTVAASGDIASYQWQVKTPSGSWKNSNATGCKTATLEITATAARNGYQYRCIVTDVDGNSVTSEPATLTVAEPVVITGSPMDSVGKAGQIAAFAVWAEGAGLTYQWQYSDNGGQSWKNSSVKAAVYSTKMTAARNGRMVRCVVTDQFGNTATSDTAVMLIKQPLVITSLPKDYVGKAGSTATFSVLAQGRGLTYQWQISDDGTTWANSSVKAASYSTKLTTAKNGRMVRCIVTDANGNSVTSSAARMTIG